MINQCKTCDKLDNNQYGFYCSVLFPKPVINNGKCSAYMEENDMNKTIFAIKRCSHNVRTKDEIVTGVTVNHDGDRFDEEIETFTNVNDALKELAKYQSFVTSYNDKHYDVEEYYVEEYEVNENDDFVSGGDIIEFAPFAEN